MTQPETQAPSQANGPGDTATSLSPSHDHDFQVMGSSLYTWHSEHVMGPRMRDWIVWMKISFWVSHESTFKFRCQCHGRDSTHLTWVLQTRD